MLCESAQLILRSKMATLRQRNAGDDTVKLQFRSTFPKQLRHLFSRLKPVFRLLFQKLVDNCNKPVGNFGHDFLKGSRSILGDSPQHGHRAGSSERRPTAGHLIQHTAKAKDIGAMIQRLPHRLFGSHVHRCSGDHARSSQAGIIGSASQSEVSDFDFLLDDALDQNITGLNVTMNQAQSMSGRETTSDLLAEVENFCNLQRAFSLSLS